MTKPQKPEKWLRGPIENVPPLLQPVAHALLQAREEINELMAGFPDDKLWRGIAGLASAGFHLQHITGVLDRLFTYALGQQLTPQQLGSLAAEGKELDISITDLLNNLNNQVDQSIKALSTVNETTLTEAREVGRGRLPSTVIGLLVHAAEHTMRHTGQLLVTATVIKKS